MIKIHKSTKTRKLRKCKNQKKWQNQKMQKVKKWENHKSEKVIKKVSKIDPPLKTPKCHLNGQNRHFVNSEPPGPALFEFQGVPRDPILRPKSDPLILNVKKWHTFWHLSFSPFYIFTFLYILWNYRFHEMCIFWLTVLNCNKALLRYTVGRVMLCVVVLPS